jgi:biotin transport system substrate-specific component
VVTLVVASQIALPLQPVPITAQTLGVLLVGAALGAHRGVAAVAIFLMLGLVGVPVFANAAGGPAALVGPTGGYLVGFALAAWIVGLAADRRLLGDAGKALVALTIATAAIFVPGLAWLWLWASLLAPAGEALGGTVLAVGLVPFLPGAIIKIVLAMLLLPHAQAIVRRLG